MSPLPPAGMVVRCSLRDGTGAVVARRTLRTPAGVRASEVLDLVLRIALEERRRGRTLSVDAPADLTALLALCGLADEASDVRT